MISKEAKKSLEILPHLICIKNKNTTYCNNALKNYIGSDNNNINFYDLLKYVHNEDAKHLSNLWDICQRKENKFEKECRIKDFEGKYQWFLLIMQTYVQNDTLDWSITCTNMNKHRSNLHYTAESLNASKKMLDASVDCIKIIRPNGTVSHMNRSGCKALLGKEEVIKFDMDWLSLLPEEVQDKGKFAMSSAAKGRNARFLGISGQREKLQYWDNILTPITDNQGNTTSILCVSRDITLQHIAQDKLRISSEQDELTGLMNRRCFKKNLKKLIIKAKNRNNMLGLILIDLDHFKHINDTLGHAAGDHLLKVLSRRLTRCCNKNVYVARLGGDEFAVIVDKLKGGEHLKEIAEKFLRQLDKPITYNGKLINGSMSLGCALYPNDSKDALSLMKFADTALNSLKDGERGGIRFFNTEMSKMAFKKSKQLLTARRIILDNIIEPYYQPKFNLETGHIIGFEALLRWNDPEHGLQFPDTIAEAFNDYELSTKVSKIMHSKIFNDISNWITQGLKVTPISINVSPMEFMRDNYAENLLKFFEIFNVPYHLIEVEVTEHILAERGCIYVRRALTKLKEAGVRIALDDFGTGYSFLSHICDYPVDILKLDYEFIHRMNSESTIYSIVQLISQLGSSLSLDVIAEGIETIEQLESLKKVGCNIGQGFLFSAAIDADKVTQMLIKEL